MASPARLESLQDQSFDVAIIGAGMNGASAAQQLAAEGYSVLLVDKGDFCAGSSSKSGRLLHCGLRYLAPGKSIWEFVRIPSKFKVASKMAAQAMKARSEFVHTTPQRATAYQCAFPVYKDSVYRRWQTEVAFRLLRVLGGNDVPLDYKWHAPAAIEKVPLARWLRDRDQMLGLATYREYQFDWPERLCVDMAIDAERMGAAVRTYTAVTQLRRDGEGWSLELTDALPGASGGRVSVHARKVLNMAGIWIDKVNASAVNGAKRRINGTKGVHIMVQMPPECAGQAVHTFNRLKEGYSCIPFRGMHSIGPTETLFDGDPDDIKPLDDEIDFLIAETNHIFPSINLTRENVLFSWAGVRPLGADDAYPEGKRSRETHDLGSDGMPGVYAMTAGPIMTHRSAGRELAAIVAAQIQPSGEKKQPNYNPSAEKAHWAGNASPLSFSEVGQQLLTHVGESEQISGLPDAMFRRLGLGWSPRMGYDDAGHAAEKLGQIMGWNDDRIGAEAEAYRQILVSDYRFRPDHHAQPVMPR